MSSTLQVFQTRAEYNATYDGDEEAHIRLSELSADEVVLVGENILKGLEERDDRILIRLLRSCEASLVHTVYR